VVTGAPSIIVFSVDALRGGTTIKVLEKNGFPVLLINKIHGIVDRLARHDPDIVILDTYGCLSDEVRQLKRLCGSLENLRIILIGDPAITGGFTGPGVRRDFCISGELDPESIISKVREAFLADMGKQTSETNRLEDDLKGFLKLQ